MLLPKPSPVPLRRAQRLFARVVLVALTMASAFAILSAANGSASGLRQAARPSRAAGKPRSVTHLALLAGGSKADCVYTANSVSALQSFERMVNRTFRCVLVYNNAAPDWASWENPWFLTNADPNSNWGRWAVAPGARRQLIITNNLFPHDVDGTDWLRAGAAGAYENHARALARNLVAGGLGTAIIRLAHEANDSSYPYSVGGTAEDFRLWREFWRRTALAMRSVPGAQFRFDWCINAYWRPIPMTEWYPGDDVVDMVGIDTYDSGVPSGEARWSTIFNRTNGISDVLRFAKAHGKPISIPEWGLSSPGGTLGGGDDPSYVNGIARVVRQNRVAYQAYFYNLDSSSLLGGSRLSLSAYRRHFGGGGDSIGAPTVTAGG